MVKKTTNKIFLFPLSLAVIFFTSIIIIFSPLKSVKIIKVPEIDPVTISIPDLSKSISSPQNISGKIDRSWVFEGSFPVELFDSQDKLLFRGTANAINWTEDTQKFIDFTATLKFSTQFSSGTLVIKNDNPSGLPENNKSFKIPVFFK